jgi:hypothetical protein
VADHDTGGTVMTWSTLPEVCRVIARRPHLRQTALTALFVGSVLFAINQLDVVLSGAATQATWIKAAVTFLVPFAVANSGLLVGCRRPRDPGAAGLPVHQRPLVHRGPRLPSGRGREG